MPSKGKDRFSGGDSVDFLDYVTTLWKSKGFVATVCVVAVGSALVSSLISPRIYRSQLTILGPAEGGAGVGSEFLGAVSQLPGLTLGIPSMTRNLDMFLSILKSRRIAESLVERYQLVPYYRVRNTQEAIDVLQDASKISVSKEGVLSVTIEDRDPRIAAELANAHAIALEKFLSQMDIGIASRKRRFIVEQLTKNENELRQVEEALMHFQEQNQAVSLLDQSRGAIEAAARLKASIMTAQVELQYLRNFQTDSNPGVVRLKGRIEELKRQLAETQYGEGIDLPSIGSVGPSLGVGSKEIYLSAVEVPRLGLQLARLTRDVKVREQVYAMLTQQLEQVKISEARDVPVVQILDWAVPAARKTKPRTLRNMSVSAALGAFVSIILVFLLQFIDRQRLGVGMGSTP